MVQIIEADGNHQTVSLDVSEKPGTFGLPSKH